jgi:hypothetical protein
MRGRSIVVWALSVASWAALAPVAWAEPHPQVRKGFWITFGVGAGSAKLTCDGCESDRQTSLALQIALGGTVSDRLLIGMEVSGWTKEELGSSLDIVNSQFAVRFYPVRSSGLFLKAGVGLSLAQTSFKDGATIVTSDVGDGFGLVVGAGYDLRVARNVSITPGVGFWYGTHGDLSLELDAPTSHWKHNVFDFTISVTFH